MDLKDFLINRTQLPTTKSSMDAYALRQKSIANNVANAETFDYSKREVKFEEEFRKAIGTSSTALTRTNNKHIPVGHRSLNVPSEVKIIQNDFSNGINNVDIDKEMALLAKTQISYDAMTKLTKKHLTLLKSAVSGR